MITGNFRWIAAAAVAAAVAWAAYKSGGALLAGVSFVLVMAGFFGLSRLGASRRGDDVLHDPAVSTLVFPPESKFQQSVLPPR